MSKPQMDKMKTNVAYEYLAEFKEHEQTYINGDLITLDQITDSFSEEDMREAIQLSLLGDNTKLEELYADEIKGRM